MKALTDQAATGQAAPQELGSPIEDEEVPQEIPVQAQTGQRESASKNAIMEAVDPDSMEMKVKENADTAEGPGSVPKKKCKLWRPVQVRKASNEKKKKKPQGRRWEKT